MWERPYQFCRRRGAGQARRRVLRGPSRSSSRPSSDSNRPSVNGNSVTLAAPAISAGFSTRVGHGRGPGDDAAAALRLRRQAGQHVAGVERLHVGHAEIDEHQLRAVALRQAQPHRQAAGHHPADVRVAAQHLTELAPPLAVRGDQQDDAAPAVELARVQREQRRVGGHLERFGPGRRRAVASRRRPCRRRRSGGGPARRSAFRTPWRPAASARRPGRRPAGPGTRPGRRTSGPLSSGRPASARSRGCLRGPAHAYPAREARAVAPCRTSKAPWKVDVSVFSWGLLVAAGTL